MIRLKRRHKFEWAELWKMTPRQLVGVLRFAEADAKRERGELLALHASAARGDPKDLKRIIKESQKD